MNALHQFATSKDGTIHLKVPAEYTQRRLEIIILPADDTTQEIESSDKDLERLLEAHRIIDEGDGIKNPEQFLSDFEKSRQDRPLPFRD